MKKIYKNILVFLGFMACGLVMPVNAKAAGFETAFANLRSISQQAGPALKAMFLVSGIFMLGMGIFKWVQASKREEPKGPALTTIMAGVLLLGIWTFAQTMSETMGLGIDASF